MNLTDRRGIEGRPSQGRMFGVACGRPLKCEQVEIGSFGGLSGWEHIEHLSDLNPAKSVQKEVKDE